MFETSLESVLFSIKDCLVRKAAVVSKLDKNILGNTEDIAGESEGRTTERRAIAADGEMRRKLVQMYKEDDSDDELG